MTSLLIEGGGEVSASALASGIVDKLVWFMAPKLMGGRESVGVIEGKFPLMKGKPLSVHRIRYRKIGEDLMIEGYLKPMEPVLGKS